MSNSSTTLEKKNLDRATVMKVAHLARLHLSEEEAIRISEGLNKSLEYFNQIALVDTRGVEPLVTPSSIEPYLRPDEVIKDCSTEELLANAPSREGQLFAVPPVL
jgi:aspartyl-tRNA(Asn)/glutamyl-tRNA(Gln) amidotransferase subunit C